MAENKLLEGDLQGLQSPDCPQEPRSRGDLLSSEFSRDRAPPGGQAAASAHVDRRPAPRSLLRDSSEGPKPLAGAPERQGGLGSVLSLPGT